MGDLLRRRAKLDHHPEVIAHDPMLYKLVILHAIEVDVLDGEGLPGGVATPRKIEPVQVPLQRMWHTTKSPSATSLRIAHVESGTASLRPRSPAETLRALVPALVRAGDSRYRDGPSLVSGVGLRFEPRGEYELKGFGTRALFAYAD